MPRYDRTFAALANRAIAQGVTDMETFLTQMADTGVSPDRVEQLLLDDLEGDGPIFGKFMRSMIGAAEQGTLAAARSGEIAGTVDATSELRRLTSITDLDDAIEQADPEALEAIEEDVGRTEWTWICALKNTCHRCLPLHGVTRTMDEWKALGLLPETIHSGWNSACHCTLVPADEFKRGDVVAPLTRKKIKSPTGQKPNRKTARAVAQKDLDKSLSARNKAMESPEGRRTLRLLGQSLKEALEQ